MGGQVQQPEEAHGQLFWKRHCPVRPHDNYNNKHTANDHNDYNIHSNDHYPDPDHHYSNYDNHHDHNSFK